MAQAEELKAELRNGVGKGAARAVRRQGKVPAVIYGDRKPPVSIALPLKEATLRLHAGGFLTHIATIDLDGEKVRVIPKDYQVDPVKDTLVHIDFLRVGEGARLTIELPIHFLNQEASPGIKRGGALNIVRHTVEVTAPADALPEYVEVDLTGLEIGDSVHISAVTLPPDVKPTISDRDFTLATIAGAGGEEENAAAAATTEGAAST